MDRSRPTVVESRAVVSTGVDGDVQLPGDIVVPEGAVGIVIFAHGSGSSRLSPRNRAVAERLQADGLGTFLLDLLTRDEEEVDAVSRGRRFDIRLLGDRLVAAIDRLANDPRTSDLPVGLFGASTGAAAALVAADRRSRVRAVVSRGGRPDLARAVLARVTAPTLMIVGGRDEAVLPLNEAAAAQMTCKHRVDVVPGAGHLFEEPGALDAVSRVASTWFRAHLVR